jgi:pilus assembly protein Flp/PilA
MLNDIKQSAASLMARATVAKAEGQALVEYSLILGLLSVIALVALTTLGTDIKAALEKVAEALAGV